MIFFPSSWVFATFFQVAKNFYSSITTNRKQIAPPTPYIFVNTNSSFWMLFGDVFPNIQDDNIDCISCNSTSCYYHILRVGSEHSSFFNNFSRPMHLKKSFTNSTMHPHYQLHSCRFVNFHNTRLSGDSFFVDLICFSWISRVE